jgi:hypothetical protein
VDQYRKKSRWGYQQTTQRHSHSSISIFCSHLTGK